MNDPGRKRAKGKGARKSRKAPRPKLTKEERRAKYTKIARERRDRYIARKRGKNLVCYRCRKRGHAASECAAEIENDGGGGGGGARAGEGGNVCYRCGSTEHGLMRCPRMKDAPKGPSGKIDYALVTLPHAECYVCGAMGHLASQCERNEGRGIFVHGGSCRLCGSKLHIAADCPRNEKEKEKNEGSNGSDDEALLDTLLEDEYTRGADPSKPGKHSSRTDTAKREKRVVNF